MTSSQVPDAQAGYEALMTMLLRLAGAGPVGAGPIRVGGRRGAALHQRGHVAPPPPVGIVGVVFARAAQVDDRAELDAIAARPSLGGDQSACRDARQVRLAQVPHRVAERRQ